MVKRSEADYLLRQLNRYLSRPFSADEIVGGFAGVRPLVSSGKAGKTKKLIREHEVEVDRESGLISVLGGKWTTYRAMAEDAINAVQQQLGLPVGGCVTREHHLSGSEGYSADYPQTLAATYGVPEPTARHLSEKFGTNAAAVLDLARQQPELAQPIVAGYPRDPGGDCLQRPSTRWQPRSTTCSSAAPACSSLAGRPLWRLRPSRLR